MAWTPPPFAGGTQITGYQVTVQPGNRVVNTGRQARSRDFTGLARGTYTASVRATNGVGMGSPRTVTFQVG